MSAAQRTIAELVAALVVIVGGYAYWRNDVRQHAVLDFELHAADSTATVLTQQLDTLAVVATGAAQQAAHQKAQAQYQLAVGRAAQVKSDSAARAASEERDAAQKLLASGSSNADSLRGEVERLIATGRRDSIATQDQRTADHRSIQSLLGTITADSVALKAEQARSQSLAALLDLRVRELALVRAQQPSFLSKHASVTVGYGAVNDNGVHTGLAVVAGWKVWP